MNILHIARMCAQDTRAHKINLSVGCLYDKHGEFFHYQAIRTATDHVRKTNKHLGGYGSELGDDRLRTYTKQLILAPHRQDDFVVSITEGGTKALHTALHMLCEYDIYTTIIGTPHFPRHPFTIKNASHQDTPDIYIPHHIDDYIHTIQQTQEPVALLLQGLGHNPTGKDLTLTQYTNICTAIAKKQSEDVMIVPILDIAYRGLAASREQFDTLIELFGNLEHCIITFSYSKISSLYAWRGGACLVKGIDQAKNIEHHLKMHTVATTVCPSLPMQETLIYMMQHIKEQRLSDIDSIQSQLANSRQLVIQQLRDAGLEKEALACEGNGMFALLGRSDEQVMQAIDDHALYLAPGGRINFSALHTLEQVQQLVDGIVDIAR